MKKRTLIIILGIWIAIVPILGLPNVWKNRVVVASALAVVFVAYSKKTPTKTIASAPVNQEETLSK